MVTFTSFSNILPDPAHPITDAGDLNVNLGTPGPGFSALSFQSVTETQVSRTISGRGVQRDTGSQHWEFTISYNPMFRYQFDPIDTFLLGRNPRKDPFYVILPQYSKPKDYTFSVSVPLKPAQNYDPGESVIMVGTSGTQTGSLRPGDAFNFADPTDYLHQKTYKVAAIELNSYYQAGTPQPGINQTRLHITPPLQRAISPSSVLVTTNPKFRVITKSDVHDHQLSTENLYSFSLSLEEILP